VVIPVHDRNPTRRTPVVTYLIIAVNVVVFLVGPVSGLNPGYGNAVRTACAQSSYLGHYAAVPKEVIHDRPLPPRRVGVRTGQGVVPCPVDRYQKHPFLSVLTAMFLHGGWAHLLGNMLFLYVFGNNVEDLMGRLRYLVFYLGVGYLATYGFALLQPSSTQPLVGASGAIAGVLGAYLWLFPRAKVWSLVPFLFFIPFRLPAWLVLGFWFVLQWLYFQGTGLASDAAVAYAAHVIGFGAGFAFAALTLKRPPPPGTYAPALGYGAPPGYR